MNPVEFSSVVVDMEGEDGRLTDLTFSVGAGEALAVIGPNRAGKSLLLKLCAGLVPPLSGTVHVLGHDLATIDPESLVALRQRVGTMLQPPGLLSNMTIFNNVALPLRYHRGMDQSDVTPLVMAHLEGLGVAHLKDRFPAQLNEGEIRCGAIARALVLDPELLLLDDPLEGLDAGLVRRLGDWLALQRKRRGLTILATARQPSALQTMVERLAYVQNGSIKVMGGYDEVLAKADADIQAYVQ
jgi:ABC-type transporter Mla maintaining outer membrane lipid asymmetry ATPase subunit MlaF